MTSRRTVTRDDTSAEDVRVRLGPDVPGLLVLFGAGRPSLSILALERRAITLGRNAGGALFENDGRLSRQHATITRQDNGWCIRDHGSRNGTFVDGVQVEGQVVSAAPRVVRVAGTLVRPVADVRPYLGAAERGTLLAPEGVVGPAFAAALGVARRAAAGPSLLVMGESGTGKELLARAFHAAGTSRGPMVAVNCAALPSTMAERQLFGARRGAYSGATADAAGHVQAAEGGVLFLDEVGELDLDVQAKLLRFLETREITPLGAARPHTVATRICAATHRELRALVALGQFRGDLYFRLAEPTVHLPPLRDRIEEIPWLATVAIDKPQTVLDARLVEALMLRAWPGNVRELLGAVRSAAERAAVDGDGGGGRGDRCTVRLDHLAAEAGCVTAVPARTPSPDAVAAGTPGTPTPEAIRAAFESNHGNLAATARAIGMHRTQLYRELRRLGVARGDGRDP